MADHQPGHLDLIKQTNLGVIYRLIDQAAPLSRIDLSRLSQLAPASITKLCRELLRAGLAREVEIPGSGSRGRPAVGLEVDSKQWHYLAVRIGCGTMCLTLYNMVCQCRRAKTSVLPVQGDLPLEVRIARQIRQFCEQCCQQSGQQLLLAAISVTLPGLVDSDSGIVRRMAFYPVRDMPLGAELHRCTGLPVFIQHDLSAWIMTETLFGASRGARDVVLLAIHQQVNATVVSEGRLLHADSGSLLELGQIQLASAGESCHGDGRGCLQSLIGTDHLLARWQRYNEKADYADNQRSQLCQRQQFHQQQANKQQPSKQQPSIETFCDAVLAGDALACQLLDEVAGYTGQALALLVNLFNPQKILIGSPLNRAAARLFPAINRVIRQQAWSGYSAHISVESAHFSVMDSIAGTARIKQAMYEGSLLMSLLSRSAAMDLVATVGQYENNQADPCQPEHWQINQRQ